MSAFWYLPENLGSGTHNQCISIGEQCSHLKAKPMKNQPQRLEMFAGFLCFFGS
uniref:Uncharacterized protein n=1 Tax=Saimiri boliviensis boliviensis TaxID=39432 RepID=A0A2K6SST1_SAIBB